MKVGLLTVLIYSSFLAELTRVYGERPEAIDTRERTEDVRQHFADSRATGLVGTAAAVGVVTDSVIAAEGDELTFGRVTRPAVTELDITKALASGRDPRDVLSSIKSPPPTLVDKSIGIEVARTGSIINTIPGSASTDLSKINKEVQKYLDLFENEPFEKPDEVTKAEARGGESGKSESSTSRAIGVLFHRVKWLRSESARNGEKIDALDRRLKSLEDAVEDQGDEIEKLIEVIEQLVENNKKENEGMIEIGENIEQLTSKVSEMHKKLEGLELEGAE